MNRGVIVLIGPIGSGKNTQADLLAKHFGFFHLETSKLIEERLKKVNHADKEMIMAKKLYDSGELVTPKLVARIVLNEIQKLYKKINGLVFSGSFRTMSEAKLEIPFVEKLYGKENIKVFYINLSEKEAIKRNSVRKICKKNRHPIPFTLPNFKNIKKCPWDDSEITRRSLDKPELIRKRYKVFLKDTKPVLNYFKKMGYEFNIIDGEDAIEEVNKKILKKL